MKYRDLLGIIKVYHLSSQVDPLLSAFPPLTTGDARTVSVVTSSAILLPTIPHLYRLASYPIVIHVILNDAFGVADYSVISAIRGCGFAFLKSEGTREAADIAATAHAVAKTSGKGVIHFFENVNSKQEIDIDTEFVRNIIGGAGINNGISEAVVDTLYADSGRTATIAEEHHPEQHSIDLQSLSPDITSIANGDPQDVSTSSSSTPSQAEDTPSVSAPSSTTTAEPALMSRPVDANDIFGITSMVWDNLSTLSEGKRVYKAVEYAGPADTEDAIYVFGGNVGAFVNVVDKINQAGELKVGLVYSRMYRPFVARQVLKAIPPTVRRIAVLEQTSGKKTAKWGASFLDLLAGLNGLSSRSQREEQQVEIPSLVAYRLGHIDASSELTVQQALKGVLQNLRGERPVQNLEVGMPYPQTEVREQESMPAHENA
ncbi:hypothetical protein KEM55_006941, partial [Ascosphaera atra]